MNWQQIGIFDGSIPFKITKPIRLIELFAGIGSQAKALKNIGADFEHYRICEFDKNAVKSYNAIHGTNFAESDITKIHADDLGIVDTDKYDYVMTYSFPCQDLSNAGKGKGMAKGSGTRSGLLWEVERLLMEMNDRPQVLLMENVPQIISEKNVEDFAKWLEYLENLGYKNYWKILNAKGFGIPQNRDRCFMVSVLGDYYFDFPTPAPLRKRLKDFVEYDVDEKYFLNSEDFEKLDGLILEPTAYDEQNKYLRQDGCVGTITTDGSSPKHNNRLVVPIRVREATSKGYADAYEYDSINISYPKSKTRRGRVGKGVAQTLTTHENQVVVECTYRMRRFTPRECFRLMGFADKDFDNARSMGLSDRQLYKQSGNSIVVQVLEAIFGKMMV